MSGFLLVGLVCLVVGLVVFAMVKKRYAFRIGLGIMITAGLAFLGVFMAIGVLGSSESEASLVGGHIAAGVLVLVVLPLFVIGLVVLLVGTRHATASAARWKPDPTRQHQWRWWDGARWTSYVGDDGITSTSDEPNRAGLRPAKTDVPVEHVGH